VENGGGCFFVKSGPFHNAGCIMYSISIFYFTLYLFGGAYAPNAPPAYGPGPPASRVAMPPFRERSVAIRYAILTCAQKLSDSQHNLAREAGKQKSDEKDLDQNTDVLRRTGASERFVTSVDEE